MKRKPVSVRLLDDKIHHYAYKKQVGGQWQTWYCITVDASIEVTFNNGTKEILCVPKGTHTDAASVPSLLRGDIISVSAKSIHISGITHDTAYLYKRWSRKVCDEVFLLCMKQIDRVGWLQRYRAYWAVRLFASKHYGGKPKQFADKNTGA